jgi:hypothetical protein
MDGGRWQDFLSSRPDVCAGEICATGTRIPVTVILDNLAEGGSRGDPDQLPLPPARAHQGRVGLCGGTGARGEARTDQARVRFKLDENLPVELAVELRAMGHDTDSRRRGTLRRGGSGHPVFHRRCGAYEDRDSSTTDYEQFRRFPEVSPIHKPFFCAPCLRRFLDSY